MAGGALVPGVIVPPVSPPMVGATPACGELVSVAAGDGVVAVGPLAGGSVAVFEDG